MDKIIDATHIKIKENLEEYKDVASTEYDYFVF